MDSAEPGSSVPAGAAATEPPAAPAPTRLGARKKDFVQLAKFLAVGAFNTFIGLALIYFCMGVLGISYVLSTALVFPIGIVISFALNRRLTFEHDGAWKKSFALWLLVTGIALGCNLAVLVFAVRVVGINPYVAQLFGAATSTTVLFLGGKIWAFAPGSSARPRM